VKALVLREYGELSYEDAPEPEFGQDEVLIAVKACGICGSDVHGMDGSTGRRKPPIIMGHEASGVIADVGADVQGWSTGDRVTFDSTVYCGVCHFCQRGQINLCDDRKVLGVSCDDYRRHGAFAEFVAVPQRILYRIPEGVSFEQASLVEPLSVAVHGVHRARVTISDTALVVGTGIIGLLIVQVLRVSGCQRIVAVDLDEHKLNLAKQLGADITLRAGQCDVLAEVLHVTGGRGADVALEAVGVEDTVQTALESVRKGGIVSLVGNVSPSVQFPLQTAVTRELNVNGSCASVGDYPACLDLICRGAVDLGPVMSATASLSEGADWFNRLYGNEAGLFKVVLQP